MDHPLVKVDVDIHVIVNFPQSEPGHSEEILTAIREIGTTMATLQETVAELAADDTELAADVTALVNIINDIPARIQAAVVQALTDAGVNDENTRIALNAIDGSVKEAIAAAKAVLPATPGGDTTSGGDTSTDTVVGGGGDDTVTGGNGSDTVTAGGGTDTTVGGQGSDTVVAGSGGDTTTAGDGPAVPPPSAS